MVTNRAEHSEGTDIDNDSRIQADLQFGQVLDPL